MGISFCLMEPRIVWTIWRPSCLHLPSTKIAGICPHSWLSASWFYVRSLMVTPSKKRYLSVKLSRVSSRGSPAFRGLPPIQTWKLADSRAKVTNYDEGHFCSTSICLNTTRNLGRPGCSSVTEYLTSIHKVLGSPHPSKINEFTANDLGYLEQILKWFGLG